MPNFYANYPVEGSGGGVSSLNGLTGALTLIGAGGITITPNSPSPGDITITGSGGTVTSVALADGSSTPIYNISGSPVTSSGTLTFSLANQLASTVFAGPPGSPVSAQPTFRALVASDIPSLAYANQALSNLTSPTAINQDLLPGVDASISLGSTTKRFLNIFAESMRDAAGVQQIDLLNRRLYDSANVLSIDWEGKSLNDGSGVLSIDYDGRTLRNSAGNTTANYNNGALASTVGGLSLQWQNRDLVDTAGNNVLNWATPNTVSIVGSLNVTGTIIDNLTLVDTGGQAVEFNVTSNTTTSGSNTTIGITGNAVALVQAGAENDKTLAGMNFVVTRGDGTDQGILDDMNGANVLMFVNSDTTGVTDNAYGFSTMLFSQKGTLTNLYDFFSQRVPAGPGVVTNHYGVYVNPDSATPVQNWLGDHTQIGGTSFVAATNALEVAGVFGIRDVASGFQVSFAAPSLAASTPYILPNADGAPNSVLTTDGSFNLSWSSTSGFANQALSNLTTTAINTSLIPDTNVAYTIGQATNAWFEVWSQNYINDSGGQSIGMTDPNIQFVTSTGAGTAAFQVINYATVDLLENGFTGTAMTLRFFDAASPGVNFVGLKAADTLAGSTTYTLPATDGAANDVLITNGSGILSFAPASTVGATNNKELFVLNSTDITNQYIDLAHVALTNSISFLVKGGGVQIEGASYDYSVSYTGGAGGNTRITFLNDLATGGASALVAGDVVVVQYEY